LGPRWLRYKLIPELEAILAKESSGGVRGRFGLGAKQPTRAQQKKIRRRLAEEAAAEAAATVRRPWRPFWRLF
jgi:hypothetical protein